MKPWELCTALFGINNYLLHVLWKATPLPPHPHITQGARSHWKAFVSLANTIFLWCQRKAKQNVGEGVKKRKKQAHLEYVALPSFVSFCLKALREVDCLKRLIARADARRTFKCVTTSKDMQLRAGNTSPSLPFFFFFKDVVWGTHHFWEPRLIWRRPPSCDAIKYDMFVGKLELTLPRSREK